VRGDSLWRLPTETGPSQRVGWSGRAVRVSTRGSSLARSCWSASCRSSAVRSGRGGPAPLTATSPG